MAQTRSAWGHKSRSAEGKKANNTYNVQYGEKKTSLVRYLLHLYCVSDGFLGTISITRNSFKFQLQIDVCQSKKSQLEIVVKSLAHFNTQFIIQESFKLCLLWKLRILGDKSRNILATKTVLNFSGRYNRIRGPLNWQITARVITERYNNRSYWFFSVQ